MVISNRLVFAILVIVSVYSTPAWPKPAACEPAAQRIALDIGHDRTRPGATSARGINEFEYNLALGRDVAKALHGAGFTAAFLIGESGAPMKLAQRTQIARERGAAIFISLHHDSAQPVYFSPWTVNGRTLRYSDNFHGYSIFVSTTAGRSKPGLSAAKLLGQSLKARGLTPTLHHAEPIHGENRTLLDRDLGIYQFNELAVLRTATMPALLLESAVIVNRAEEQAIQSGAYHPRVVAALVEMISRFCGMGTNASSTPVPMERSLDFSSSLRRRFQPRQDFVDTPSFHPQDLKPPAREDDAVAFGWYAPQQRQQQTSQSVIGSLARQIGQ